ncbi:MAG: hypothetical protein K0S47_621 [Herbinix sp.]|jgi:stage II sporulation protein R|nr:hypothetical protein [Herbinix sp.]
MRFIKFLQVLPFVLIHKWQFFTLPLKKKKETLRYLSLIVLMILTISVSLALRSRAAEALPLQEGIAKEVIRFHVIANSDSNEDQALKLKVKEALTGMLSPVLNQTKDINEARNVIKDQLDTIENLAEATIYDNGYSYPVTVTLENCYFPIKVYGDYTFPSGTYEALRVKIGAAEGQNWWCVMFPPLCFVDETYSIVSEESDQQLKHILTEDEYESLKGQKVPVKIKFKIFDYFKSLWNK